MFSKQSKYTLIAFFFVLSISVWGQNINVTHNIYDSIPEEDDTDTIFESQNDSIDIIANWVDFSDSLSILFPADSLYQFWNNEILFDKQHDLSQKTDTTYILLQDMDGHCFVPPLNSYVTSDFGLRHRRYHYGIDIKLHVGDSLVAPFDGMVRVMKWAYGYGWCAIIRHNNGLETLYGHLSKFIAQPNQTVKAGEVFALGGNTGRSTGPHLHFEVRYLGTPINPRDLINFDNNTIHSDTLLISKKTFEYIEFIKKLKKYKKYKKYRKYRKGKKYISSKSRKRNNSRKAVSSKTSKKKSTTVKSKKINKKSKNSNRISSKTKHKTKNKSKR